MSIEEPRKKIIHHVTQLYNLFGVQSTNNPECYAIAEQLEKNIQPHAASSQTLIHSCKMRLAEGNPQGAEFLRKYEELKLKNVKELDPLVATLERIKDTEVPQAMEQLVLSRATSVSDSSSGFINKPIQSTDHLQQMLAQSQDHNRFETVSTDMLRERLDPEYKKHRGDSAVPNIPLQPDWLFTRPYQTYDYVLDDYRQESARLSIGQYPLLMQEQAIIDDMLHLFMGVQGIYIKPIQLESRYATRRFHIDATLDAAFSEVVAELLPICSNYSTIARFQHEKSAFEYGMVNQALAEAIWNLITDFTVLVCQMESKHRKGELKLTGLLFYMQESKRMMEALAKVCDAINTGECIGGAVLSVLQNFSSTYVGDTKISDIYTHLMQAACVPYFEILQKWLYRGVISDPYLEFFIKESLSRLDKRDFLTQEYINDYWEKHYSIISSKVPTFLEPYSKQILDTGKYINVVRQCNDDNIDLPAVEDIAWNENERLYVDQIDKVYKHASRLLLHFIVCDKELKAILKTVKHYFLLDRADFIVHFLDAADAELKKSVTKLSRLRLQSLLELALRTSTADVDKNKDNLKVILLPFDLTTQIFKVLNIWATEEVSYEQKDSNLSGLEAFCFDYNIDWPLSLVLNRKAIERYQLLFRHFFYCKHVERLLCNVWILNKNMKIRGSHRPNTSKYYTAFALRQRMLNFIQHLQYYMAVEVIEPNFLQFMKDLEKAQNLDEVLSLHIDFLNLCHQECMLTSQPLLKILHKIMMVCVTFVNCSQRLGDISGEAGSGSVQSFECTIEQFDKNFTQYLIELLSRIKNSTNVDKFDRKLMNLVDRLDLNGFYAGRSNGLL